MLTDRTVYMNGAFYDESKAALSPFNRGLLYGDGIFETMRCYRGALFCMDGHFERLKGSADYLKIDVPFDICGLRDILNRLLEFNSLEDRDSRIRLNIIRGEGRRGLLPDYDAGSEVIITAEAVPDGIEKVQREGIKLVLIRNIRFDGRSPLASHKTFNYIPGIFGLMEVREQGGDEGLFLDYDGNVVEGVTSNIFMVKTGRLFTPPLSAGILPGITRQVVIDLAVQDGIVVEERDMAEGEVFKADELFITSSVREVVPVVSLDSRKIDVGPVTMSIQQSYKRFVAEVLGLKRHS